VWIGGAGPSPLSALFVPPAWERVPARIEDLAVFAARNDVPALAQAAIIHAQFETIHPFPDGNGRTGRVLIHTVLRRRGLTPAATVPVSAGLLANTGAYFRALDAYREGDADSITTQLAGSALLAVAAGRQLLAEISELRERQAVEGSLRRKSAAARLADELFAQPVVNAGYAAARLGVSYATALAAARTLEAAGILRPVSAGRRNQIWEAPAALDLLEAFAARAARRSIAAEPRSAGR
jgi:Fic family protein